MCGNSGSDELEYVSGERSLTIYTDSGHFDYNEAKLLRHANEDITDFERADKDCREILNSYGVLPENCEQRGYLVVGNVEESASAYGPAFVQTIDGIPVLGYGWVRAVIHGDGKLSSIEDCTYDYEYQTTMKTISFESAFAKITDKKSFIDCNMSGKLDRIVFNGMELVYCRVDGSDYCVPCFRFKGTAYSGEKEDKVYAFVIVVENFEENLLEIHKQDII